MPPRWSRKPDRADPEFRRLDDRMTFATHVALFAATNSGLWFFRVLGARTSEAGVPGGLPFTPWITTVWATVLVAHAVYIFAIAKYSIPPAVSPSQGGKGFGPDATK
ncbi:MAG: 2TM domain-containing protein [Leptolyngbyaceae cyanobacterium bins.349]|nr:2TM domain-containing protein [Leptolyngbyaceae cyanobacterium bins.349]